MGLSISDRHAENERIKRKLGLGRSVIKKSRPDWIQLAPEPSIFEGIKWNELMLPMIQEAHSFLCIGTISGDDYRHLYDLWFNGDEDEEENNNG